MGLKPAKSVECIGIKNDKGLAGKNAILSKLWHFLDRKTLKAIYHAIFEHHLHRILVNSDCLGLSNNTELYGRN